MSVVYRTGQCVSTPHFASTPQAPYERHWCLGESPVPNFSLGSSRNFFAFVFVAASVSCGDRATSATHACPDARDATLVLERHREIDVGLGGEPIAVAVLAPDSFLVATQRRLFLYSEHSLRPVELPNSYRLTALWPGEGAAFVGATTMLTRVDLSDYRATDVRLEPPIHGQIVSGATRGNQLWMISQWSDESQLHVYQLSADGASAHLMSQHDLDGEFRISIYEDGIFLSAVSPPFVLFAGQGPEELSRVQLTDTANLLGRSGQHDALFSMGTFPLDCGFAFTMVTDLRSDYRALILIDLFRKEVLRARTFHDPMALTSAVADHRLLIGGRERAGATGVVMYKWSWADTVDKE
jgi:hypothetical protein